MSYTGRDALGDLYDPRGEAFTAERMVENGWAVFRIVDIETLVSWVERETNGDLMVLNDPDDASLELAVAHWRKDAVDWMP